MFLSMLNTGDKEANQILMDAIKKSKIVFKDIGSKIYSIVGFDLMQASLNKIPNQDGVHTVISEAWDGIGDWIM